MKLSFVILLLGVSFVVAMQIKRDVDPYYNYNNYDEVVEIPSAERRFIQFNTRMDLNKRADKSSTTSSDSQQKTTSTSADSTTSHSTQKTTSDSSKTSPSTTQSPSSTSARSTSSQASSSSKQSTSASSSSPSSASSTTTSSTPSSTSSSSSVPPLTTSSSTTVSASTTSGSSSSSPLPTLTKSTTQSIATPTVTVPSMSNNPFMSESNLPEGTVFIAVGSIIGGFGFLLVLWRIIATVSLKRAADRARKDQKLDMYSADQKTPLFASGGRGNPSSEDLGLNSNSTSLRNPTMTGGSMNGPQPGLFFSPTAEVMNSANNGGSFMGGGSLGGSGTGGNARNSVYMPAGYYDSGATGGGAPSITSRSTRHFSMARDSMYGGLGVRSSVIGGGNRQNSEYMPQQRAPSAYLDDLLAHEED